MTRVCIECAAPIAKRNVTGRCRSCGSAFGKRQQMARPGERERMAASMLVARGYVTPEVRKRAAAKMVEHRLGWCPVEYRALNAQLGRMGIGTDDRKRMIGAEIGKSKKPVADIPPPMSFERQMERVRNGEKLIERFVVPRGELAFTAGGVASYG